VCVSADRLLDLHERVERLAELAPGIRSVALFGSRRFKSGSPRSDVDLLVEFDGEVPPDRELADIVRRVSVYFDIFVVEGSVARSAINGSRIAAGDDADLRSMLDAVEVWVRSRGVVDTDHGTQRILEDWVPIYTMALQHGDETADREPIDYLLITALADEFSAVQAALGSAADVERSTKTFGRHLRATITHAAPNSDETVVVCQSDRMGNVASALTTAEALQRWAPRLTVLVGITGGIRGRTRLGDLVVATQIFDYEAAKVTWRGVKPHGIKLITSFSARQRLETYPTLNEVAREIAERSGVPGESALKFAAYASGEKVVASARLARSLARHDRKIAAVEMEALGVGDACRRVGHEFMVLKAVTDFADRRKSDDVRLPCCAFASEFLVHAIRHWALVPRRPRMAGLAATIDGHPIRSHGEHG